MSEPSSDIQLNIDGENDDLSNDPFYGDKAIRNRMKTPPKTASEILDEYYAPIKLPDNNRDGLKAELWNALQEMATELDKPVPADDEWHRTKKVKAVPLESIKDWLGVE